MEDAAVGRGFVVMLGCFEACDGGGENGLAFEGEHDVLEFDVCGELKEELAEWRTRRRLAEVDDFALRMQVIQGLEEKVCEEFRLPEWHFTIGEGLAKCHERHTKRVVHKAQMCSQGCCQLEMVDGLPDESPRHVFRAIALEALRYLQLVSSGPVTARVAGIDGNIPRACRKVS